MEEKKKTKTETEKKKRGRLTLNAYLLHLRHLGDGLLQVFQELEQLLGTLGAEVEHLLLIRAERREDGDAVWVVCRQDMRQTVSQSVSQAVRRAVGRSISQSANRAQKAPTYTRFQRGGTASPAGPWLCRRCTPPNSSSLDRASISVGEDERQESELHHFLYVCHLK